MIHTTTFFILAIVCQLTYATNSSVECIEWRKVEKRTVIFPFPTHRILKVRTTGISCDNLAREASIPLDEFRYLNPHLKCEIKHIVSNVDVCFKGPYTINCADVERHDFKKDCQHYFLINDITLKKLKELNPTMNCDNLKRRREVCTAAGPYKYSECARNLRVYGETDTCQKILNRTKLTEEQLFAMNPKLNCSGELERSTLVCVESFGMDVIKARKLFLSKLVGVDPRMKKTFRAFKANPSKGFDPYYDDYVDSILDPEVHNRMKELYENDAETRKLLDGQHKKPRELKCEKMQHLNINDEIKKCYCGQEKLIIYCEALAYRIVTRENEERKTAEKDTNITMIGKRSPIPIPYCKPDGMGLLSGCIGGTCGLIFPVAEVKVHLQLCMPIVKKVGNLITACKNPIDCIESLFDMDDNVAQIAETVIHAELVACIGPDVSLGIFESSFPRCVNLASADYFIFTGMLHIYEDFDKGIAAGSYSIWAKLHGMAFPELCEKENYKTNYCCKWKDNGFRVNIRVKGRLLSFINDDKGLNESWEFIEK